VTITKVIILLIFSGFGIELILRSGDPFSVFRSFTPNGPSGVFKAMGLTFIAFQGFEVIAQSSEEIRNPRKNIPRAVFLSLVIVIPIYIVVGAVALAAVKPGGMTAWDYLAAQKEIALVEVARTFFVGGGVMLLVGGLISTMSALNATIYSSSRVAFAMGRDRNFPALFGRVHPRRRTPHWGILVSLIIVVAMALSLPLEDVASAADIMFLLLFLLVNIAMIRLRSKRPDLDRGYKVPVFPALTIVGIVLLLFLAVYMLNYSVTAWIVTVAWIFLGLVVYRFYSSRREIEHAQKLVTLDRLSKREYGLLVFLDHGEEVSGIVSIALAVGRKHSASIIFLRVVEVPEGKPLTREEGQKAALDPALEKALGLAETQGVSARALVRVARRATEGVLETAIEEECNLILRSQPRRPGFLWRVSDAMFDSELRAATGELATLHGGLPRGPVRKILALSGDDPHSRLAAESTSALVEYFGAELRVLSADPDDRARIFRASRWADLLVIGRPVGGFVESLLVRTPLHEIETEAACPVLSFREFEEPVSLWKRLFQGFGAKGASNGG
jgi:basic amino acid/polyamine antiporter, APA family